MIPFWHRNLLNIYLFSDLYKSRHLCSCIEYIYLFSYLMFSKLIADPYGFMENMIPTGDPPWRLRFGKTLNQSDGSAVMMFGSTERQGEISHYGIVWYCVPISTMQKDHVIVELSWIVTDSSLVCDLASSFSALGLENPWWILLIGWAVQKTRKVFPGLLGNTKL